MNEEGNRRFFVPYVGSMYNEGIRGKKILVLGASFYCDKDGVHNQYRCPFFDDCTNPAPSKKDSSKYNLTCPIYSKDGFELRNEPSYAIDSEFGAYQTFAELLHEYDNGVIDDAYAVWDKVAFTDYVQFFVPPITTKPEYLSERDFKAFYETLCELKPDIVIAWGVVITEELRTKNPFVSQMELDRLPETEYYVWRMRIPEVNHDITIINCFHPSAWSAWKKNLNTFKKYLNMVLA